MPQTQEFATIGTPSKENARSSLALARFAVIIAVSLAYYNGLTTPFVFDDIPNIVENPSLRRIWPPWSDASAFGTVGRAYFFNRPVVEMSFALNFAYAGLTTWPYHLTNILIHLAAALLLFEIVRQTLLFPSMARFSPMATPLALAVGLLWGVHPQNTQAVTGIIQRYESMMGMFLLFCLYAAIKSATSPHRRYWMILSPVAYLLALWSKEVAVSAPLIILLYDRAFLAGSFRGSWKARWPLYLGLLASLAVYFIGYQFTPPKGWAGFDLKCTWIEYALSQPGVIVHYLRTSLWPSGLCADYYWPIARTPREIVPALTAIGLLGLATLWLNVRHKQCGFLGAWFFLLLAPTSSILPIADLAFDHRMYLSLIAVVVTVVLATASAAQRLEQLRWIDQRTMHNAGIFALAITTLALVVTTQNRNSIYADIVAFWQDVVDKSPENPRAHSNLGTTLAERKRFDDAVVHYRKALEIKPNYPEACTNLGLILALRGEYPEAIALHQKALDINPRYAKAHYNLGIALAASNQVDEAVAHYRKAFEINPGYTKAYVNLGVILFARKENEEAIRLFQKAVLTKPDSLEGRCNLANALSLSSRTEEAIDQYRVILRLRPDFVEMYNCLGLALAKMGQLDEAILQFTKAVELKPDYSEARRNLELAKGKLRQRAPSGE